MSREDYIELVQDLCEELQLGDAGEFLERGLLQVDETLVGIEYLEERDELRLLADLGELEDGIDRNAMLELLLQANVGNTSFYLPTFSLHPQSDHPVVACHIRPGAGVLAGAMASLDGQQDRLIRQAKREKGFAKIRAARAGAAIGGGISGTVLAGAVLGGVVASSVVTPFGVVVAVPALVGSAVIAVRGVRRHWADHTSKWRQRAAAAAIQGMTRKELEQALCKPAGDKAAEVTVNLAEGEYLAGEDRFAGERTMTFDVRKNEYVGLHIFALQIQDLVRNRDEKAAAPWIATLQVLGVDSVRLLAICKAAAAKPAAQQLDYIKSQLAPVLGMKYRMTGSQALPHPSVFLGRFQNALLDAGTGRKKTPMSTSDYRRVREALIKQFADGEEALAAFKASTSEFLRKTAKLPPSPLRSHLRAFLELDGLAEPGTAAEAAH